MTRDQMSVYQIDYRARKLLAMTLFAGAVIYFPCVFDYERKQELPIKPQSQIERTLNQGVGKK